MIYLIGNAEQGICKIGYSQNPKARLANLQVATPNPLRLVGTLPGSKAEERLLHQQFASEHIAGEWFRATPEIIAAFEPVREDDGDAIMMSQQCMVRLAELNATARKVFSYVLSQMQRDTQRVPFSVAECQEFAGLKFLSQVYTGLADLTKSGLFAKVKKGEYVTNPELLYKGAQTKSTYDFTKPKP